MTPVAVAVDVGGTKTAGGLVGVDGEIHTLRRIPTTGGPLGDPGLVNTVGLVQELVAAADRNVTGIGVGFPEVVTPRGELTSREVIDWTEQPLITLSGAPVPVVIESDVRCGALSEAWFGVGAGYSDFAYISVGTGLSYTHVINRIPRAGTTGAALWLGALPVANSLRETSDPDVDLESFASGRAIATRYQIATETTVSTPDVFKAADAGDHDAVRIIESAGAALGSGVAHLILLLDPAAVIFGGGMADAPGRYWTSAQESMRKTLHGRHPQPIDIYRSSAGAESGVLGAGCAVFAATGRPLPPPTPVGTPWVTI